MGRRTTLVLEGTVTYGDWYPCTSVSTGGWLGAGAAFYTKGALRGGFVHPKARVRAFHTRAPETSEYGPCSREDLAHLDGFDAELGASVHLGWAFPLAERARTHVWLAPALGAGAGLCVNCVTPSGTWQGTYADLFSLDLLGGAIDTERRTAPTYELLLGLVRLGAAW